MPWRLSTIFVLLAGAACAQVPAPNTPAGQTLRAWLDAFNSGDRTQMGTFLQKYAPRSSGAGVDAMMHLRDAAGTLEFLTVDKITPAGAQSPVGLYSHSLLTGRQPWKRRVAEFFTTQINNDQPARRT